jgi:alginate O-acetyltransferase complex protein AlgI
MLFNSLDFAIFLPVVFILYWFVTNRSLKLQNFLIVIASYIFYGWWDWRFLSLILFSTAVDYIVGLSMKKETIKFKRRALLISSIIVNLGFLGVFKYYNFFIESFIGAYSFFGLQINANTLNIILPVGISFYTFQTLSYSIDIYRKKLEPTKDFVAFAAFVSFFPQLVAGPIERASNLLPQFYQKRKFEYANAVDGMRQILWGLFKKVVIADNCAEYANIVFNNSADYGGSTLLLGAVFFAFQIYGDFSGYSDIAIGSARLFGFNLMQNFAFPYFSRDIAEFWRRWHISLSTWFRDYLYIPLGGSKGTKGKIVFNTFVVFVVSGFWHGANWTFIAWGALNAIYFLPLLLTNRNRVNMDVVANGKWFPSIHQFFQIMSTFFLTTIAWVFFRADSIYHAINYVYELLKGLIFRNNYIHTLNFVYWEIGIVLPFVILMFLIIEWYGREQKYAIEKVFLNNNIFIRYLFYYSIILCTFYFSGKEQAFIYFQF